MLQSSALEKNVDLVQDVDRAIYLVGTAHVSPESVELAERTIRSVNPDCVAVELCEGRYKNLKDPERWKHTDIFSIIRQGKALALFAQVSIASFQKKLGKRFNVTPGAEMLKSISLAEELRAKLVLADRNVTTTLKRCWAALSLRDAAKLFNSMLEGYSRSDELSLEELEKLKSGDALESLVADFGKKLPRVHATLIDERDQYLAAKIYASPGKKIVAVVGAGHIAGIKRWLGEKIDLAALESEPKRTSILAIVGWGIPIILLLSLVYGLMTAGADVSLEMIKLWCIVNGTAAAIGAILALAHPLSIIAAFLSAPITTLSPAIGSGMVAALVETWIRKPRVLDFEDVAEDLPKWRAWWKNRLLHVFLVLILTSITGALGVFLGLEQVITALRG